MLLATPEDAAEDMAAFTAAAATLGPHSHSLPPMTLAEVLSRLEADRLQAAIDEELGSYQELGVWEKVYLPEDKQALPSFFAFEIKRD
jgi:hypothetical protein